MKQLHCPYCAAANVVAGFTATRSQVEGKSEPPTVTCFKCRKKFQPKQEGEDNASE